MIIAKKNAAYYLSFPAIDSASPGSFKSGISPVDTAYYKDGAGAWTLLAISDTATEIGSTGVYEIDLTAVEMNHDKVIIKFAASGMADDAYQFDLRTQITDDLATSTALATVQSDLDTLTGTDGVILATTQPNYAPATAAALATVDGIVDNILVDTGTTLPATLTTIEGKVDTVDANVDLVLADTAELQGMKADTIIAGTASGTPTTTTMVSDVTVTVDNQFNGRIIIFDAGTSTAALQNQATDITACTAASNTLTFTALTTAPSSGDTFKIV